MPHIVVYKSTYHAKPHSVSLFLFTLFFFLRAWPRSWHEQKASVELSGNLIGLLPKMSVSDWLLQHETAATTILNRAKRQQKWTFIYENTTSTVQLQRIFKQTYNHFVAKHTQWLLQREAKKAPKFEEKKDFDIQRQISNCGQIQSHERTYGGEQVSRVLVTGGSDHKNLVWREGEASHKWTEWACPNPNRSSQYPQFWKRNNDHNLAIKVRRGVVTFKGNKDPREKNSVGFKLNATIWAQNTSLCFLVNIQFFKRNLVSFFRWFWQFTNKESSEGN